MSASPLRSELIQSVLTSQFPRFMMPLAKVTGCDTDIDTDTRHPAVAWNFLSVFVEIPLFYLWHQRPLLDTRRLSPQFFRSWPSARHRFFAISRCSVWRIPHVSCELATGLIRLDNVCEVRAELAGTRDPGLWRICFVSNACAYCY